MPEPQPALNGAEGLSLAIIHEGVGLKVRTVPDGLGLVSVSLPPWTEHGLAFGLMPIAVSLSLSSAQTAHALITVMTGGGKLIIWEVIPSLGRSRTIHAVIDQYACQQQMDWRWKVEYYTLHCHVESIEYAR